ncbi:alpha/beta hydrolase, partial [Nostoc sp. NIES-2111]
MFDAQPDSVPSTADTAARPVARGISLVRPATSTLWGTDANPVPDGARTRLVETADGVMLRAAGFPARGRARGTVLLLQGRGDQIEKYFEVVDDLRARGFGVLAFDWRGQGGSQRLLPDPRKSHVDDFAAYRRDRSAMLGIAAGQPGPLVALG